MLPSFKWLTKASDMTMVTLEDFLAAIAMYIVPNAIAAVTGLLEGQPRILWPGPLRAACALGLLGSARLVPRQTRDALEELIRLRA